MWRFCIWHVPILRTDNLAYWDRLLVEYQAGLDVSRRNLLKLTGVGVDEQTVADFLRRLSALSFFRSVDLDETSQVSQDGAKLKKFVIRGQLDYGGPVEPVAAGAKPGAGKAQPAKPAAGGSK